MSKLADLHERWSREPEYREAYDGLGRSSNFPALSSRHAPVQSSHKPNWPNACRPRNR